MASSRYTFMLDLHSKYSQIALPVTAGDTDRELCISFSDGGRPFVFTDIHVAKISFEYPTKNTREDLCVISEDGSYVKYEFDDLTCPVSGIYQCQVVVYKSDKKIAAPKFTLEAEGRINTDDSGGDIPEGDMVILDSIYQAEAQRQENESERRDAEDKRENAEKARAASSKKAIESINETKTSIEKMRDNGGFDGFSPSITVTPLSNGYHIEITEKGGVKKIDIFNGAKGDAGASAYHEWNGTVLTMRSASGSSSADLKGEKGDKGDRGDGIDIVKTFDSVAQMLTTWETDGVPIGKFVLIASNVDDEDNAKLYVKTEGGYLYLTDLSGAQGIKGEKGDKGADGKTPYIQNGYWYINGVNTTVKAQGNDGKTPQKGVDYWTPTDKAEIKAYVDEAILGGEW